MFYARRYNDARMTNLSVYMSVRLSLHHIVAFCLHDCIYHQPFSPRGKAHQPSIFEPNWRYKIRMMTPSAEAAKNPHTYIQRNIQITDVEIAHTKINKIKTYQNKRNV